MHIWTKEEIDRNLSIFREKEEARFQSEQSLLKQPRPIGCRCTTTFTCKVCLTGAYQHHEATKT